MSDAASYYAHDYKILLKHEDEDQIYDVVGDEIVYRTDHQLSVFKSKITSQENQKLLDYGCAKAPMAKRLRDMDVGLDIHLFDVSEMYREYWSQIVKPEKCAVNYTPDTWLGQFDVVTSFFSLEHINDPRRAVRHIVSLLKDNGTLYAVVPDIFGNVADFVVLDHVNHFTRNSVLQILKSEGLGAVEIDDVSHRGALVFTARKTGHSAAPIDLVSLRPKVDDIAKFWTEIGEKIREAESSSDGDAAIYGSGFYGAFIYARLRKPTRVRAFLDQSPFRQGENMFEVPIVGPTDLPSSVRRMYVGLNPKIARETIAALRTFRQSELDIIFLDDDENSSQKSSFP